MMSARSDTPRGIRNNNPLNIRENHRVDYDWEGEHPLDLDSEFEEFVSPQKGIRAAARILRNYRVNRGLDTVSGIISRWAPPKNEKGEFENHTESYIKSVAQKINIDPHQVLSERDYPSLIKAMIYHENGQQPYSSDTINQGFQEGFYS
ncbi:structural protein [Endozoicomonas sp. G2_1]|uniref:structural protein n=1 Tax=Endozoicomonas sp. G2_1 TaxID=2821091 RepID=UPI001AD98F25|nr:structural protein [Endozoicomonas sp. G2_1]MBO9490739.1 structural protein [Endozoicomonas sp. G2_1]